MSDHWTPSKISHVDSNESAAEYSFFEPFADRPEEELWLEEEAETADVVTGEPKKCISVGDSLPYGPRLYYGNKENVVRMKDIGEKHRIILVGVIGSFTPDCWNRHLYKVLSKLKYYSEREIDYICCVSTNDGFTQRAWGEYLGCQDSVLMWGDITKRFTKAMGMDIVLPWLDNTVRSKRYVIYAEDMVVTKMIMSHMDGPRLHWQCGHLEEDNNDDDDDYDDSDSESWV